MAEPKALSLTLAGSLLILFTLFNTPNAANLDSIHVPCAFIDTVDLTGHEKFPNGSYSYNGLIVPPNHQGIFDYINNEQFQRVPASPHVRGCVCKLRPCVKLCCPDGEKFNGTDCALSESSDPLTTIMNVTNSLGEIKEVDISKKFAIQVGSPCGGNLYHLTPHINDYDKYHLFENGTLYRWDDNRKLSKDEYCLSHYSDENYTDILLPLNCFETPTGGTRTQVYAWIMVFSVPFMILTIIVYLGLPELRTLHGKSFCCYLLGLCIGYSILSAFILIPMDKFSQLQCKSFGFLAYTSFMASFFWLSAISFDLFYNIQAPRGKYNERKRFLLYSIYAWGLALISFALTYTAQQSTFIPYDLKPQIGGDEYCWLNVKRGWSAMIYFYGPIIVIIAFNTTMFTLTALKIHNVQKEMKRMIERNDSQKNLRSEKDKFGIFLRLFIVMGVTWSMETISYVIGQESEWNKIFYITDALNGIQGFLIFTLFVLKKKVKQHIINRYASNNRQERQSQYSTKTTSSSIVQMNGLGTDKPLMDKFVQIKN